MGTYSKGILGAFSGKVGPVVGAQWRNKDVLRSLPKKSNRIPSEAQKNQRIKFTMVIQFLSLFKPLLTLFYSEERGDKSRFNIATSYHLKEAIADLGTGFVIIYNKVLISKGDLVGIFNPQINAAGGNTLKVTWTDNSGQGDALATDELIAVVYEPVSKTVVYGIDLGNRSAQVAIINLPSVYNGLEVQCWISFVSADEKSAATSFYGGAIIVT